MVATGTPVVMGLFMVAIGTAAVARGTGCGCTNGRVSYVYTGVATGFLRRQSGIPALQHSSKIQQGRTVTKNHAHHGQPPPSVVVTVVVVLGLGLGLGLEEATNAHKRHRSRTVAVNRMVILPSPCVTSVATLESKWPGQQPELHGTCGVEVKEGKSTACDEEIRCMGLSDVGQRVHETLLACLFVKVLEHPFVILCCLQRNGPNISLLRLVCGK